MTLVPLSFAVFFFTVHGTNRRTDGAATTWAWWPELLTKFLFLFQLSAQPRSIDTPRTLLLPIFTGLRRWYPHETSNSQWNNELWPPVRSSSDWGLTEGVRLRPTGPHYDPSGPSLSRSFFLSSLSSAAFLPLCNRHSLTRRRCPRTCPGNPSRWGARNCVEGNAHSPADFAVER